jgi:hypothetical protein
VHSQQRLDVLNRLDYNKWKAEVGAHLASKKARQTTDPRDTGPFELFEAADERVLLRAIVEEIGPDEVVTLDVSELAQGGWLDDDVASGGSVLSSWDREASPPIVITEGTYDAQVLTTAIEILMPHLAGYIKFLDYEVGNEGGASAAVRTLKSFAAAGISNRIVAIFDNDSAAYEAAMALTGSKIPAHYRIMHYPDLDLAKEYPTLGPQGDTVMNVNRLAGSIELYLGSDVLVAESSGLIPVQWKGYMGKVKCYQGEIVNKAAVQRAFREKVKLAKADPKNVSDQDWSGLQLILDRLIETLSSL